MKIFSYIKNKKVMKNQKGLVKEVKHILPIVVQFKETYGFESFDYGFLYGADQWECSFFKNVDDDKPSLYFLTDSKEELIYELENYG